MSADIKIHSEDGRFKFRVCGIIRRGDKYLLQVPRDGSRYIFPGGHIELGESTSEAVVREVLEEVHVHTQVNRLVCVHEYLFYDRDGNRYNEMAYYYLLDPLEDTIPNDETFMLSEIDKGSYREHTYRWADVNSQYFHNAQPRAVIDAIIANKDYPIVSFTDER